MMRAVLLWVSENRWCSESLPRYRFVKRAVKRFMPGETLEAALAAAKVLEREKGIPTLVTFLGENVADPTEAEAVVDTYLETIEAIDAAGVNCELSIKPTHLGLDLGQDIAEAGIRRLAAASKARGKALWLDMEYSRYVDPTLDLYRAIQLDYNNLGICLQAYLHRTAQDVEDLLPLGPSIRLVKGAYAEPPEVAIAAKADVDENFFQLSIRMLSPEARGAGLRAGLGTHDVGLIKRVRSWATANDVGARDYEVQMLYGIALGELDRLAKEGEGVRVLISFGTHWFPWYVRRLAERPANVWFVVRSMLAG